MKRLQVAVVHVTLNCIYEYQLKSTILSIITRKTMAQAISQMTSTLDQRCQFDILLTSVFVAIAWRLFPVYLVFHKSCDKTSRYRDIN